MKSSGIHLGLGLLLLVLLALSQRRGLSHRANHGPNELPLPYRKKDYFFSRAERSFYEVLLTVLDGRDVHVYAKVRVADLLYLPAKTVDRQSHWNRIQSKHIDFIICDKRSIAPLVAIELDDASHNRADRMERDRFVGKAFSDAGLPLLRFPVKSGYVQSDLESQITNALAGHESMAVGS